MDPGDADEAPDREQLESRVDELEQTVSKMLPDRRGVIKGLGAAAIGGAAVGASTGGASGQSAAGQVGTESEPVDVEAANVAAQSVSTDESRTGSQTVTVNVPGDFATVGAAVDDIDELRTPPGVRFVINIESGHQIQNRVTRDSTDLRHVTITSEDATVSLDSNIDTNGNLFQFSNNSRSPIFDILIDASGFPNRAITAQAGSVLYVDSGGGATGADINLSVTRRSTAFAAETVWDNASTRGVEVSNASLVYAQNCSATNSGNLNVRCGNSVFQASGADLSGATGIGVLANQASRVNISNATVSNSSTGVKAQRGTKVAADGITATGVGFVGLYAEQNSEIAAQNSTVETGGATSYAIRALDGGAVDLANASIDSGDVFLSYDGGGVITLQNTTIDGVTKTDVLTDDWSFDRISTVGVTDEPYPNSETVVAEEVGAGNYYALSVADAVDSYLDGTLRVYRGQSRAQGQRYSTVRLVSRYNSNTSDVLFHGTEIGFGNPTNLFVGDRDGKTWVVAELGNAPNAAEFMGARSGETGQLFAGAASDFTDLEAWNNQTNQNVSFNIVSATEFP